MTHTLGQPAAADVVNALAGIAPDGALGQLRAQRADALRHAQGSYDALLEPEDEGGLSRAERHLVALRVAVREGSHALAAHHVARAQALDVDAATIAAVENFAENTPLPARLAQLLRHTDLLTSAPRAATRAQIEQLHAVGLSARNIVSLSQLIAFESFQVRLLAGLHALQEAA